VGQSAAAVHTRPRVTLPPNVRCGQLSAAANCPLKPIARQRATYPGSHLSPQRDIRGRQTSGSHSSGSELSAAASCPAARNPPPLVLQRVVRPRVFRHPHTTQAQQPVLIGRHLPEPISQLTDYRSRGRPDTRVIRPFTRRCNSAVVVKCYCRLRNPSTSSNTPIPRPVTRADFHTSATDTSGQSSSSITAHIMDRP